MAIRFTAASSQNLELTSGLPDHNANYTWAGWIYFHTVSGNQMFLDFQSSGHAWQDMDSFTAVGSQWRVESNNGGSITDSYSASSEVASGTWYYVACVRESSTSLKLYVNGVQKCNATGSTASRAACAYVNFGAYYTGYTFDEHCNAKFYGWKAWARALTLAELSREMRQAMPTDASSLYGVWPFLAGSSRATDFSGRGHTWTEYNSPTDEDPPPIAWGGDPDPIQFVTVAGGGAVTATGSMSFLAPGISGNGEVAITGAGTIDIPVMTTTGNSEIPVLGDGILIWPLIQLTGDGKVDIDGSGGFDWPTFQITGTGTIGDVITGDGSISFTIPIITGQGEITVTATGTIDIPVFTLTGQGELGITGQGTLDFPVLISTVGQGEIPITGTSTGPLIWPIFDLVGTGEIGALPTVGFGTLSIPKMALSGSAEVEVSATGTITFPVFAVTTPGATGTLPPYVTVYIWRRMR